MATDPEAATPMRRTGSHDRRRTASTTTTASAMSGIPTVPPRSVKRVTHSSLAGVRLATAASRTGWSSAASPSLSTTSS